jgi:hypothetical protein
VGERTSRSGKFFGWGAGGWGIREGFCWMVMVVGAGREGAGGRNKVRLVVRSQLDDPLPGDLPRLLRLMSEGPISQWMGGE